MKNADIFNSFVGEDVEVKDDRTFDENKVRQDVDLMKENLEIEKEKIITANKLQEISDDEDKKIASGFSKPAQDDLKTKAQQTAAATKTSSSDQPRNSPYSASYEPRSPYSSSPYGYNQQKAQEQKPAIDWNKKAEERLGEQVKISIKKAISKASSIKIGDKDDGDIFDCHMSAKKIIDMNMSDDINAFEMKESFSISMQKMLSEVSRATLETCFISIKKGKVENEKGS